MTNFYIELTSNQIETLVQNLIDQIKDKDRTIEYQRERINKLEKQLADLATAQVQEKEDKF